MEGGLKRGSEGWIVGAIEGLEPKVLAVVAGDREVKPSSFMNQVNQHRFCTAQSLLQVGFRVRIGEPGAVAEVADEAEAEFWQGLEVAIDLGWVGFCLQDSGLVILRLEDAPALEGVGLWGERVDEVINAGLDFAAWEAGGEEGMRSELSFVNGKLLDQVLDWGHGQLTGKLEKLYWSHLSVFLSDNKDDGDYPTARATDNADAECICSLV